MTVNLDSPATTATNEPRNDTPRAEAKAAPKKKASAKQTAKDPKLADAAKAEKQAKEIVALGARVMEKVRAITTDPKILGNAWTSPMMTSIKQRSDDLQQRIKDNPHMARAMFHAVMVLHLSNTHTRWVPQHRKHVMYQWPYVD
jgi:hypothetical protein